MGKHSTVQRAEASKSLVCCTLLQFPIARIVCVCENLARVKSKVSCSALPGEATADSIALSVYIISDLAGFAYHTFA